VIIDGAALAEPFASGPPTVRLNRSPITAAEQAVQLANCLTAGDFVDVSRRAERVTQMVARDRKCDGRNRRGCP
jgi:hypothetical protein